MGAATGRMGRMMIGGEYLLPMSPNFRSSKIRNFFRRLISCRPVMVRSEKWSMMSACVFSTQMESPTSSASFRRAEVEVTSAETHRLERLMVISWSRYEARGWVFGRSARTANGWVREECCGADMMPVVEDSAAGIFAQEKPFRMQLKSP